MRLIDADALKEGFESSDFDDDPFENVDNACRIVNSYPTIPAIPMEWMMKVLAEANEFPISERETIVAISYLVKRWQKEQEAR